MKSILMSIKPKYCELIANGKKTVEVRKTKPKIDVPFKCYIYETKGKLRWCNKCNNTDCERPYPNCACFEGKGKVIGEFVCDTIHEFTKAFFDEQEPQDTDEISFWLDQFQLSYNELRKYVGTNDFYGWQITDLVIYDKPKELSEFYIKCNDRNCEKCEYLDVDRFDDDYITRCEVEYKKPITRPPQSYFYIDVEELGV